MLIQMQPSLARQVYDAVIAEICEGTLPAGAHLVQEQLAERLGVSRQPVQQAMALLKADGMVEESGRRGLRVTPLDLDLMAHHYAIRAALDGLAARGTATRARDAAGVADEVERGGRNILREGEAAAARGDVAEQVAHDFAFHTLLYDASGNPLLARTAEPHWRFLRRAMGDVLRHAELPREIWRQHAAILDAVVAGKAAEAEALAVDHDLRASDLLRAAFTARGAETDRGAAQP